MIAKSFIRMISRVTVAVCLVCLVCIAGIRPGIAAADLSAKVPFKIAPQQLSSALLKYSQQAQVQVTSPTELIEGKTTAGVVGTYPVREALNRLLRGTSLGFDEIGSSTVTIRRATSNESSWGPSRSDASGGDVGSKLSLATARTDGDQVPLGQQQDSTVEQHPEPDASQPPVSLDEVVVTGSHIRGAPPASPVVEITQTQMIQAGQTNLGEVIRSIPQNFAGGQNPGVVAQGSANIQNQNVSGGSSLNLRGLGPDATLTLLNGHRLSYDGFGQGVDISQIPLAALSRIEIVADGASAIYGSDAVGGVANVILKPDYDGLATTARVGQATSGGDFQQQYGIVGGTTWSTGGFIATLNFENDTNITKEQRNYTDYLPPPYTILPSAKAETALLSGHQALGPYATFRMDALYTRRYSDDALSNGETVLADNRTDSTYNVAPSLTLRLPATWTITLTELYGRDRAILQEPEYAVPDGTQLSDSKDCYCNTIKSSEVDAEGLLFHLPGGAVRAALGGGYRKNEFELVSYANAANNIPGQEHSYFAFGELYLPIIAPELAVPLVERLSLTGAVRHESYNGFGGVTTPKIGLVYAPSTALDFKASWGRSYKIPTLLQEYQSSYAIVIPAAEMGAIGYPSSAAALWMEGGNRQLKPERATSWTTTLTLHPQALPTFQAEVSYFHIDYTDRILQPVTNYAAAFSNPNYAQFLELNPTAARQQQLIAGADRFINEVGAYNPADVIGVVNDIYFNAASQRIHGVDLSSSYRLEWHTSSLTFSGSASWLDSQQKNNSLAPAFDLSGTIFNPPSWHSRFGLTWERGPLTLSAFHNYIAGVTDTTHTPNIEGGSMQTIDLAGIYHLRDIQGLLRDVDLSLSVQNLTNQSPPVYRNIASYTPNYDSTNYSPIGRFISLAISKRWL